MTRLALTVAQIGSAGLLLKAGTPSEELPGEFVAAEADGHSFLNDGDKRTFIAVDNSAGAVSTTLTIETYGTIDGLAISDRTVVVGAGDMVLVRPGPTSIFNRPDSTVWFGLSPVTDVTVAVVKVTG